MTETEPVQKDPLDLNFLVDRCKTLFLSPPSREENEEEGFYSVNNATQDVVRELIAEGNSSQEIAIRLMQQTSLTPQEIIIDPRILGGDWDDFKSWDTFWMGVAENILQLETENAFPDYEQIEEQRDLLDPPF